ncbi:MAG TPA: MazG nucleotide pyrophosphohydrolase domain-containing protein [Exilispira sp.]|nr:MazG nucleotide pyrophosphohydrolase domain-containing protein [Exilispira sp.]
MNADNNFSDERFIKEAERLKDIVKTLRSPQGCPWDRKLKIEDCTEYILEETYEAIDAIDKSDKEGLLEELGDILSQVFMISQIASENNLFDITDVFNNICNKLVFRHPHVFMDEKADTPEEVLKIWNRQKLKEKSNRKNIIEGIPKNLPSIYILVKLFRKIQQYPKIYDLIKKDISYYFESFNKKKDDLFKNIEEFLVFNDEKKEQDTSLNKNSSDIISNLLYVLIFYCFSNEIDPEKLLRKKIDNIYKFFDDNENAIKDN